MDREKCNRRQAAGWKFGTVAEFLDLPPTEALFIDIRARLAAALIARRAGNKLTQAALARRIPTRDDLDC